MTARSTHYPPSFEGARFNCVYCGVYAEQSWGQLHCTITHQFFQTAVFACRCLHCGKLSFWLRDRMLIPGSSTAQPSHPDMPDECRADYEEARDIADRSPRAAAALLRLCVQKLMSDLGEAGKNINDDIASLVAKGLPVVVQQAFDVCRVVGNNAVHPGEIDVRETPEIVTVLFQMINLIVEDRIARPKAVQAAYDQLPEGARAAIKRRDA